MYKKKLMAGLLSAAMVVTMIPVNPVAASAEDTGSQTPVEITLDKNAANEVNPIGGFVDDNYLYGGDPAVLVDGDTVYLYEGHDTSKAEGYYMPEWVCYSTKDLKDWKYEGVVMKADKQSISWANTGTDAWAGQIVKHKNPETGKDMYYFYFCTWDVTSGGSQSIGVATSDSPTGPFTDIGEPLVKGTFTSDNENGADGTTDTLEHSGRWSNFNDIDPTVWIETDGEGNEHRYLNWGNNRNFTCELNEDMTSIKDVNGDNKITFGTQVSGATSQNSDVIEMIIPTSFTEAPWIYRRTNSNGDYYGDYYLFYAYGWREQMAYATMESSKGLMNGKFKFQNILMEPTATSNTNHMAVFDFKEHTYFVYHNGSLPGGSGFRRSACITEINFNDDGSIDYLPETTVGIWGKTSNLYTLDATVLAHESFNNSSSDDIYPYKNIELSSKINSDSLDSKWVFVDGKSNADTENASYVSIQSENKPGLFFTANDDKTVTLAQDSTLDSIESTAKTQTFKTVSGLNNDSLNSSAVSFESVSQPGYYIYLDASSNTLKLTNDLITNADACTFYTERPIKSGSNTNSITSIKNGNDVLNKEEGNIYNVSVPYTASSYEATITLSDTKGYFIYNDTKYESGNKISIPISGSITKAEIQVIAENNAITEKATICISIDYAGYSLKDKIVYKYNFDDSSCNAYAVTKGLSPAAVSKTFTYSDDAILGKSIYLDGSFGLKLANGKELGNNYTISFWMKPESLNGAVDPVLSGGVFNPQYWFNLTFDAKIWSYDTTYKNTTPANAYKTNQWQHVALSVDGTNATLYLDGKAISTGTIAENILTKDNAAIYFGVNGWDAYYKGFVDEITMYNDSLTTGEIIKLSERSTTTENVGTASSTPNTIRDYLTEDVTLPENANTTNSITNISVQSGKYPVAKIDNDFSIIIPDSDNCENLDIVLTSKDPNGYIVYNGKILEHSSDIKLTIPVDNTSTSVIFMVYAQNLAFIDAYSFSVKVTKSETPVSQTPVYEFNFENSTDGAKASIKGTPTTLANNPEYTYVDGYIGKAIYLDGTSYGLRLTNGSKLGSSYSISYWMKPDKLNGENDPTLFLGTTSPQYWTGLPFNLTRPIWSNNGGYIDGTVANSLYTAGIWQHITFVVDDNKGTLYVNGAKVSTSTVPTNIFSKEGSFVFFGMNGWDAYFQGALDNVKIYNRAITEDEISKLANENTQKPNDNGNNNSNSNNNNNGTNNSNNGTNNNINGNNNNGTNNINNGTNNTNNSSNGSTSSTSKKKVTVAKVKSLKLASKKKKQLTVSWKKASKISGYQVQYSTKKNFKSAKTVAVKKTKTSYTIKKLTSKKKYYVRIRAYKTVSGKKYYSSWVSTNKKVK